ncbi:hypothetical protein F0U60_28895 [Archangium minus]|uniref:Uncharacterized protein n=1 Tax=Archangium minus TaxID=83450 RepID=A0ABY9WX39_9BACT|nr:hypothetical protein F0U60_28895 [Archangium minus]
MNKKNTTESNSFISRVRKNKIPQPSQTFKFSIEQWEKAFTSTPNPTDADKRLYEAGKWFSHRFQTIAQRSSAIEFGMSDQDKLTRLHCGTVNRDAKLVNAMTLESARENDILIAEKIIQSKYQSENSFNAATPEDLDEAAVDGLRFALDSVKLILKQKHPSSSFPQKESIPQDVILGRLRLHLNFGSLYDALVDLWNECVWNDWHVLSSGETDLVTPYTGERSEIHLADAISRYRLSTLTNEISFHVVETWSEIPAPLKRRASRGMYVQSISGSGKHRKIHFGPEPMDGDKPSLPFAKTIITEELYFSAMLDIDLPTTPGVTLRTLLNAWKALYYLSEALFSRLPSNSGVFSLQKLNEYSPTLSAGDLIEVIRRALDCPVPLSRSVLSYFVRGGFEGVMAEDDDSGEEFWHKPILRLQDSKYVPILAALNRPNLVRSIEFWTKRGGLDLEDRGTHFESYARKELAGAIERSPLTKHADVVRDDLVIPHKNGDEQIDLAFWIGNSLVLGEAKCILIPSSPNGKYHYYNTLIGAVAQIERKVNKFKSNITESLVRIPRKDGWEPERIKVIPIVLTSTPIGAGLVVRGVPVVDIRILRAYFDVRKMRYGVLAGRDGREETMKTVHFYESPKEAEENIQTYVLSPPQLALPRKFVSLDVRPLPLLAQDEKPAAVCTPQVKLPIGDDKFVIQEPEK